MIHIRSKESIINQLIVDGCDGMEYIELCFITVTQINELGNPKTRKTKDVPMFCEVSIIIIRHKNRNVGIVL